MVILMIAYGIAWLFLQAFSLYMQFAEKEYFVVMFVLFGFCYLLLPQSYCWDCFCTFLYPIFEVVMESVKL